MSPSVVRQFTGSRCHTRVIGWDDKDFRALAHSFQCTEEKLSQFIRGKLTVWAALSAIQSHGLGLKFLSQAKVYTKRTSSSFAASHCVQDAQAQLLVPLRPLRQPKYLEALR